MEGGPALVWSWGGGGNNVERDHLYRKSGSVGQSRIANTVDSSGRKVKPDNCKVTGSATDAHHGG